MASKLPEVNGNDSVKPLNRADEVEDVCFSPHSHFLVTISPILLESHALLFHLLKTLDNFVNSYSLPSKPSYSLLFEKLILLLSLNLRVVEAMKQKRMDRKGELL